MSQTVYDAILDDVTMRQITRQGYELNGNVIAGVQSGNPDPSELYGGEAEPKGTWETADIATYINQLSAQSGKTVAAGTVTLPWRKRADAGAFASGSVHFAITCANALIIPTQVSANQGDEAALAQFECWFRSTDGTNPVSSSTGNALAAQAFVGQYALGPVSVNGAEVSEITGTTVNYGIEAEVSRYGGLVFPQRITIRRRRPTIELNFESLDDMNTFMSAYGAITSVAAYLRRRKDGDVFEADGASAHAKFSFASGVTEVTTIDGQNEEHAGATLRLHGKTLTHATGQTIAV